MLLAVRLSSYGCTWKVCRALKKLRILFAKQELIKRVRRRLPDFETGENLSFNQSGNKEFCVFLGKVNL